MSPSALALPLTELGKAPNHLTLFASRAILKTPAPTISIVTISDSE